jgi:hypothetical protein
MCLFFSARFGEKTIFLVIGLGANCIMVRRRRPLLVLPYIYNFFLYIMYINWVPVWYQPKFVKFVFGSASLQSTPCTNCSTWCILTDWCTEVGCPRNERKKISVRTETNRNKICFAFVSVCFVKPKIFFFGLFRCFEPLSKQPKQTELF